jgi:peptidoglycan hydrolase-like protein with peptidoglycan-binding domain
VAALLHTPSPGGPGLDGPVAVQRCGPAHPDCGCSPEERRAAETADDTESGPQPVQREVPGGGGGVEVHLRSARFAPSAKLELCFQDRARLRRGDPDTDAVQRVQEALLALPAKTGRTYDLGEKGADGVYGAKTAAAVVKFKSDEALGSTQFDDVGPGTMRRLDELFASGDGPLPPCPVPIPITTSFADGPGGAKAKVGALPIPGVNCQVIRPPVPPAPTVTDFATIPDPERRRIRIAADNKVPVEFDRRYSTLDKDGNPFQDTHVGTIVFGPGIADQTVQAGLSRVAGVLHTSQPALLTKSRTVEMLVRNGFDKRTLPGVVIPGGIFRFTRFTLGTADTTLVERIGNVPPAPGPAPNKAAASAALRATFSNLVFIDDLVQADQLPVITTALTLARRAVGRLPQFELDISPGVTKTGEDGIWDTTVPTVDPITQPGVVRGQQLKLFANAFRGSTDLSRPGGQEPAVWTVIHEVGHGIAFANKGLVTQFDAALLTDGGGRTPNPVTDYGAKAGEGFPEALAFFYTDPAILQATRPATFAFMRANF